MIKILNKKGQIIAEFAVENLIGADLRYANLRGADLSGADIRYANLIGDGLRDANLSGAMPTIYLTAISDLPVNTQPSPGSNR